MSTDGGRPAVPLSSTRLGATRDGVPQLRRRWPARPARAAVLLVHGIGEHSGRYEPLGRHLSGHGFDVLGFDLRGFGQSGGPRAHVDRIEQYLDDIEDLLAEQRRLSVPVVLFGHSMGGLLVTRYLVDGRPRPDLVVLSSPALDAEVPRWQRLAAPVLGRLAPRLRIPSRIEPNQLSCDAAVGRAYLDDPLVVRGATASLGRILFEAMSHSAGALERITAPTYVFHGSEDSVVPVSASASLERLPNVTRRIYPGLLHECLSEPDAEVVLADVLAWLEDQLAALD